jgi:hypothetical protein
LPYVPTSPSAGEQLVRNATASGLPTIAEFGAAKTYGIQMMPTQVFFGPDGREVWRHMGKLTEAEVIARLGIDAAP